MADPKKNVAYTFTATVVDASDTTQLRVNPTLASGDAMVSIDDADWVNLTNLPTVIFTSEKIEVVMTSGQMNGDNIDVRFKDQTVPAEWNPVIYSIQPQVTVLEDVDAVVDSILVDTAEIGAAGAGLTAINLPNQTMDIVGNITGNLSGSVGSVTTVSDKTGYRLSSTGVGDILTTALTEAYAADGATMTLSEALYMIKQMLMEFAIVSTTLTVNKLDGTTSAMTFTLDSATSPTSITRAT